MFGQMKSGNRARERARYEARRAKGIRSLPSGTVLHLNGIPVSLRYPADVVTAPENWNVIDAEHANVQEAEPPSWAIVRAWGVVFTLVGVLTVWLLWGTPLIVYPIVLTIGAACFGIFAPYWAVADNRGQIGE